KVVRSTAGSLFHVPVVEGLDMVGISKDLKGRGFTLAALSGDGKMSYDRVDWGPRTVLIVGNEGHGVSRDVRDAADMVVKIPRVGKAESLNVGVACGIVLSHLRLLNHHPSNEARHR
ncbi:MAG TPA: RNA methyltransferase, partial [Bacteroidota bacterium]